MLSLLSRRVPTLRAARAARAALVLSTLALAAACDDDDDEGEEEPDIQSVRLTVTPPGGAATAYVITTTGATPSPVQLRVGTSAVSAVALDDNNQSIALESDFELRVVGALSGEAETALPAGITFVRNSTLSSTITATAAAANTTVPAVVRLFHRGEGHSDFDAGFQMRVVP